MSENLRLRAVSLLITVSIVFTSVFTSGSLVLKAENTAKNIWNGEKFDSFEKGSGTENDPYIISNGGELYYMASLGQAQTENKFFRLSEDIYLNNTDDPDWKNAAPNEWKVSAYFAGRFDGGGHRVYGIYCSSAERGGLFAGVWPVDNTAAEIKNVGIDNSYIKGSYAGGIIGSLSNSTGKGSFTMSSCYVGANAEINGKTIQGGLIGYMDNPAVNIENCYSLALLTGKVDSDKQGGIIGFTASSAIGASVESCYAVTEEVPVTSNTWPGMQLGYKYIYGTNKGNNNLFNFPLITVLSSERMQGSGARVRMSGLDFDTVWQAGYGSEYPSLRVFSKAEITVWDGKAADGLKKGSGTKQDPYIISNGGELYYMLSLSSGQTSGKYFRLSEDIYLNNTENPDWKTDTPNEWTVKGYFAGCFDGGGHTVYGIYRTGTGNGALFPNVWPLNGTPAEIKNIGIESSYINASAAGGIIGSLSNSTGKGSFSMNSCYVGKNVEINGKTIQGGLVGSMDNPAVSIKNSYSLALLSGKVDSDKQGGIIGFTASAAIGASVESCYAVTEGAPVTSNTWPGMQLGYKNVYGTNKGSNNLFNFPLITVLTVNKMQDNGAEIYMTGLDFEKIWVARVEDYPIQRVFANEDELDFSKKFSGGDGSENNPYIIKNADELHSMTSAAASKTRGKYFMLAKDITDNTELVNNRVLIRKNNEFSVFYGCFDGGGHMVSGLYSTGKNAALFGKLGDGAVVENVGIEDSYFKGEAAAAVAAKISGKSVTVRNCYAGDKVEINGTDTAGGIVAEICNNRLTVTNCFFTGAFSGQAELKGGIAGNISVSNSLTTVTLSNCYTSTPDNDYTVAPVEAFRSVRCINLYGTRKQTFGGDGSTSGTGMFKTVSLENMTGSGAAENMPLLNFDSVWAAKDGTTPRLRAFTGEQAEISGNIGSIWSGKTATAYAGGNGTKESPYKIATPEQLALLVSTSVYEPYETLGKYYEMTEDILLNNTAAENWYTADGSRDWFFDLGYNSLGFMGCFNGNGHSVDGVCYKSTISDMCYGLFPSLGGSAVVENTAVSHFYSPESTHRSGAIAGFISLYADNENVIHIRKCISAQSNIVGGLCAGGILGHCAKPIVMSDCLSMAVVADNHSRGTLIGTVDTYQRVTVKNCLTLEKGRAASLHYSNNGMIPELKNVYSTAVSLRVKRISESDVTGSRAADTLSGFDFENVWQTVEGGTPVPRAFAAERYSLFRNSVSLTLEFTDGTVKTVTGYPGDIIPWSKTENVTDFDWYLEKECLRKFAYNTFPCYDITLYAKEKTVIWSGASAAGFSGGAGTEKNPYMIANGEQLYYMLTSNNAGKYYIITADIYLNDITKSDWIYTARKWASVAMQSNAFKGHLDGGGHTVYGIYCENAESAALIPLVSLESNDVDITNIGIDSSFISGKNAAGLIGKAYGNIKSLFTAMCYVGEKAEICGTYSQGGIIGTLENTSPVIKNCGFTGLLSGKTADGRQGGIVGFATGSKYSVKESYAVTNEKIPVTYASGTAAELSLENVYGNNAGGIAGAVCLDIEKMRGSSAEIGMSGLDFKGMWQSGVGYPILSSFSEYRRGDANKDGKINIADLIRYKKLAAGENADEAERADLDGDGNISGTDLAKVRLYLLKYSEPEKESVPKTLHSETGNTYNLVWNDEFDKDGLDYNKWCFGYENGPASGYENMLLLTEQDDPSIVTAEGGLLKMNARRYFDKSRPEIKYATSNSLGTRETMNFKYGYVEMRAMVPTRQSAFPAFWSIGKPGLINKKNNGYYTEMDFFECFSHRFEMIANFHKWYDNGAHTNFDPNTSKKNGTSVGNSEYHYFYFKDYKTLPYEFHLYAFEWTKEYIKVYIDNECFVTLDITMSYDGEWEYGNSINTTVKLDPTAAKDMSGYHDYTYLLLQNLIYNSELSANGVTAGSAFPYRYYVDYVRLYQDKNNSDNGLIYLNDAGEKVNYYSN